MRAERGTSGGQGGDRRLCPFVSIKTQLTGLKREFGLQPTRIPHLEQRWKRLPVLLFPPQEGKKKKRNLTEAPACLDLNMIGVLQ